MGIYISPKNKVKLGVLCGLRARESFKEGPEISNLCLAQRGGDRLRRASTQGVSHGFQGVKNSNSKEKCWAFFGVCFVVNETTFHEKLLLCVAGKELPTETGELWQVVSNA